MSYDDDLTDDWDDEECSCRYLSPVEEWGMILMQSEAIQNEQAAKSAQNDIANTVKKLESDFESMKQFMMEIREAIVPRPKAQPKAPPLVIELDPSLTEADAPRIAKQIAEAIAGADSRKPTATAFKPELVDGASRPEHIPDGPTMREEESEDSSDFAHYPDDTDILHTRLKGKLVQPEKDQILVDGTGIVTARYHLPYNCVMIWLRDDRNPGSFEVKIVDEGGRLRGAMHVQ